MSRNGKIKWVEGAWQINAYPHVVLKMKRVFPKIRPDKKLLLLSDTLENCRELAWFLERYPMDVERDAYLRQRAKEHEAKEHLIQDVVQGAYKPRAFSLALPPRDYQRVAAELWLQRGGLLLADEMGLGKTISAICGLTDQRTRPALVVTMTHTQFQWADEIAKFAPGMTTHILEGTTPYDIMERCKRPRRDKKRQFFGDRFPDVLITNYAKLDGWGLTLAGKIKGVVFDEGQELRGGLYRQGKEIKKNIAAQIIASKADFRILLSGTPIYNYGGEIYNVLETVCPGELGTEEEFANEWGVGPMAKLRLDDPQSFGTYARRAGLILRRTREDVERELPPLTKIPFQVETNDEEFKKVEGAAAKLAQVILSQGKIAKGEQFTASGELDALIRHATGVAKAPAVAAFTRMIVETGQPVVLWGWHRSCYEIWLEELADLKPVLFTGSESMTQKEKSKQAFLSGASRVLIMSLRAGAGLDGLQKMCCTGIFGELDFSPGVMEQCTCRIFRDGQDKPVAIYIPLADEGSDPIVADILGVKKEQIEGFRDPTRESVENLEVDGERIKRLAEHYLRKQKAA